MNHSCLLTYGAFYGGHRYPLVDSFKRAVWAFFTGCIVFVFCVRGFILWVALPFGSIPDSFAITNPGLTILCGSIAKALLQY